jgi:hypothetical protein
MANAAGRLAGTIVAGVTYLAWGFPGCLWTARALVLAATLLTLRLPDGARTPASAGGVAAR